MQNPIDKYAVAQVLREIGFVIEIIDDNPKKAIAYGRAAHAIESVGDFNQFLEKNTLESIPGVGQKIAAMIKVIVKKGYLPYHSDLLSKIPKDLIELTFVPGLGSKKIRILYENFQITNLKELESAFKDGKINGLKGFGPTFIKKTLKHISFVLEQGPSLLYPRAFNIAQAFIDILNPVSRKIELTGDLRRKLEVIKQIDFLIIPKNIESCISLFTQHPLIKSVLSLGMSEIFVLTKQGIKAYLHFSSEDEFGIDLLNTTGNTKHVKELEKEALQLGYHLREHVIESVDGPKIKKMETEYDIYKLLNLHFIPSELREGYGEIEAAKISSFNLIQEKDLCGAFHCHTVDSDGRNTIEEMVVEAKTLGWEYIGISDHSKSSYQANGMSEERLLEQIQRIRQLNDQNDQSFHIFSGIECDILKEGSLDFSDEVLMQLDFVIVSIHRFFNQEEDLMTKRLIKAIENPYTTMVGHLTGRLLRLRDPYQLNIPKVIDACIANDKIMELNAYPSRLDMDWRLWIKAKEKGLKCCINPDAHSLNDLMNCHYGINIARKGWLQKGDVINTLHLKDMKSFLRKFPQRR